MEKRIKVNLGITMSDIVFVILMWLIFVISFVNIEIMYRSSVKKIFLSTICGKASVSLPNVAAHLVPPISSPI